MTGVKCEGYGLVLAPNQTPDRDFYLIQKLCNLVPEDGFHINTVFSSVFFLLGILPVIYTSLIIPAAQSKNKVAPHDTHIDRPSDSRFRFRPGRSWQACSSLEISHFCHTQLSGSPIHPSPYHPPNETWSVFPSPCPTQKLQDFSRRDGIGWP